MLLSKLLADITGNYESSFATDVINDLAGGESAPQNITSNSATAFTVGANGVTNPVLQVDASATNVATGIKITGGAPGIAPSIITISSNANEALLIKSKGTGQIALQPGTDSTLAVNIRNAAGTGFIGFDSTNKRLFITSADVSAFSVGLTGVTNPVLQVDSSVGSQVTGISIQGQASTFAPTISAISSDTNIGLTLLAKGTGTITLGSGTNTVTVGVSTIIQNASANALVVGPNGATTPGLRVDASAATAITGIKITMGATGVAPILSSDSSDAAIALVITTKGNGQIQLRPGSDSTTAIQFANAAGSAGLKFDSSNKRLRVGDGTNPVSTLDVAGTLTLSANNIATDTTTGMKIATATTQKLGFFNATPVVQPAASADAHVVAGGSVNAVFTNTTFDGTTGASAYTIGGIVLSLKNLGLLAA